MSSSNSFLISFAIQPTFAARSMAPFLSTGAGTPTPMPQISSALRSFSAIFPLIASATSGRIRSPSFSV